MDYITAIALVTEELRWLATNEHKVDPEELVFRRDRAKVGLELLKEEALEQAYGLVGLSEFSEDEEEFEDEGVLPFDDGSPSPQHKLDEGEVTE